MFVTYHDLKRYSPSFFDSAKGTHERWEGVLCTLQKPTLHNLADKYQCRLLWCVEDKDEQFHFTCEHPNHINKTEMKRCPCPCFPIILSKANKHESFPFPNIEGLKGKSETKLYPRCYDLKSCK